MINIIDEKPIPIYEETCPECGSVLEYTAAEVAYSHITCPVCRCSMWAMTLRPKRYQDRTVERSEVEKIVRCKDCKYMTEHYDTDGNVPYWTCSQWDSGTDYDGFCHYAERKENR